MDKISERFEIIVKTFHGLEEVLAKEIQELGGEDVKILKRAVSFTGNKELLYSANYNLRTAIKVLKPIYKFKATNEVQLYNGISGIDWTNYFSVDQTIAIDSVISSDFFNHSHYVALKVKDAIIDQFRKKTNKRPSIDTTDPEVRINIHILEDDVDVSLDSSGESLHKRGYRVSNDMAPISEVLAAGLIMLSGWDGKTTFVDPMCGSGTIAIEAALIANKIPPGIYRKKFSFENWLDFDEDIFEKVSTEEHVVEGPVPLIYASDISSKSVAVAKSNFKSASLGHKIITQACPFSEFTKPSETGFIIMNPPYGERLKDRKIDELYKSIGDTLKKQYLNWEAWIITSNKDAIKNIGLHAARRMTLFNGQLECKFLKFSIYEGSKKESKNKEPKERPMIILKRNSKID